MIICSTRFFGHNDYIILTFKAEFVCPACSDFITSSYLNAPEALKLHTNGFSLYYYDFHCVHCYKRPHLTWPQFWCHTAHTWIKTIFLMMEIVTWNIPLSNGKTENSLLGVWFWGSVSHFRSRPFVTGSYICYESFSIIVIPPPPHTHTHTHNQRSKYPATLVPTLSQLVQSTLPRPNIMCPQVLSHLCLSVSLSVNQYVYVPLMFDLDLVSE